MFIGWNNILAAPVEFYHFGIYLLKFAVTPVDFIQLNLFTSGSVCIVSGVEWGNGITSEAAGEGVSATEKDQDASRYSYCGKSVG